MRLHRFYIDERLEKGKIVRISDPDLLHQWLRVFRMHIADRAVFFNNSVREFEGIFETLNKNEATIVIYKENKITIENLPKIELHVFLSIIKKDNFELVVEKCTELGAMIFHPLLAERSEKKDLNIERLRKIAIEASEQSGRVELPVIFEPADLESAVKNFEGTLFALDFDSQKFPAKLPSGRIGILIGPEGGWTENERDFFEHKKIKSFSLGPQILRAETAAIAISSLILLK